MAAPIRTLRLAPLLRPSTCRLPRTIGCVPLSRAAGARRTMADEAPEAPERKRFQETEYIDEDDDVRPFTFDDISSVAHSELELHREARQYNRVAAYEMPRLSQLARPFEPPTKAQCLRFRYTTYMGEEHPAESKVVVQFSPLDLELSEVETNKLIKLVGPRFNPETGIVKMSCEMFENQAQNKRYLGDLVDKLIVEAKDPTDTFEDIPFDFRHHKFAKPKPEFPTEWVETAKRKEQERLRNAAPASAIAVSTSM